MRVETILEWEGREYDYNPKSNDWYWSIGIIAVASLIAAILFGNYLLALLITIAAITLALHAAKEPSLHKFRLVENGIIIDDHLHTFEQMESFSALEDIKGEGPPILSIKTKHWLFPHLVIPLNGVEADVVYEYFFLHVNEDEHHHTFVDLVARWLGF